jgi:3-methylfumaryl-CoA hydratase
VTVRTGMLDAGTAAALAGLLDRDLPATGTLPLLWHQVYLLDRPRQRDLGPDGHPVRDAVPTPPAPGLRRMFAGGRVTLATPLRLGEPATRRSTVTGTRTTQGRSGTLTFVTVTHEYHQGGALAVTDEQDLVYREQAAGPRNPGVPGETVPAGEGERAVEVDPTLLFRFSALTYNAHRVHYDRDFATGSEGYPGLLVHGPLQALLMAEQAERAGPAWLGGGPARFEYRLLAPLCEGQGLIVGSVRDGAAISTYVRDVAGRRTATGALAEI